MDRPAQGSSPVYHWQRMATNIGLFYVYLLDIIPDLVCKYDPFKEAP